MKRKYTEAQIQRALKKLAQAIAEANYPRPGEIHTSDIQRDRLWEVFREAYKVIRKTGNLTHYKTRMDKLDRIYSK